MFNNLIGKQLMRGEDLWIKIKKRSSLTEAGQKHQKDNQDKRVQQNIFEDPATEHSLLGGDPITNKWPRSSNIFEDPGTERSLEGGDPKTNRWPQMLNNQDQHTDDQEQGKQNKISTEKEKEHNQDKIKGSQANDERVGRNIFEDPGTERSLEGGDRRTNRWPRGPNIFEDPGTERSLEGGDRRTNRWPRGTNIFKDPGTERSLEGGDGRWPKAPMAEEVQTKYDRRYLKM